MMRDHGGFEGNAQTFRIVTSLEPYTEHHGMNLSRRTLLGLLKYPALLSATRAAIPPPAVAHQRQLKAKDWSPAKASTIVISRAWTGCWSRCVKVIVNCWDKCAQNQAPQRAP